MELEDITVPSTVSDVQVGPKKRGRKPKTTAPPVQVEEVCKESKSKKGKLNLVAVNPEHNEIFNLQEAFQSQNTICKQQVQPSVQDTQMDILSESVVSLSLEPHDVIPTKVDTRSERSKYQDAGYFQVLQDFSVGYPTKTNIFCWWCCHPFATHPIGLPMSYNADTDVFKVYGCFCSFSCAAAYKKEKKATHSPTCDLLFMYKKVTGDDSLFRLPVTGIEPAPDKMVLKCFGGQLSIDEFRSISENEKRFDISFSPMMPWAMYCEELSGGHRKCFNTKSGVKKPLEIRKAKKIQIDPETAYLDEQSSLHAQYVKNQQMYSNSQSSKQNLQDKQEQRRTTVTQLISFG